MANKFDDVRERSVVNDAIQFWKGYLEALLWILSFELGDEIKGKINAQYEIANVEFESFKIRWRELSVRKKNARRSKRN